MVELRIPLYNSRVYCFFSTDKLHSYTESLERVIREWHTKATDYEVKKKLLGVMEAGLETTGGMCYWDGGGMFFIFLKSYDDFNLTDRATFVHECGHAAFEILRRAGLTESPESTEAYTYLLGYICERLWVGEINNDETKTFKNKKKFVNHKD